MSSLFQAHFLPEHYIYQPNIQNIEQLVLIHVILQKATDGKLIRCDYSNIIFTYPTTYIILLCTNLNIYQRNSCEKFYIAKLIVLFYIYNLEEP